MKKYTKPRAKFHVLKSCRILANSDNSLSTISGNTNAYRTEESLSKSASFSFGDDDE